MCGVVFFADHASALTWTGIALVVVGVALINVPRRASATEQDGATGAAEEHTE